MYCLATEAKLSSYDIRFILKNQLIFPDGQIPYLATYWLGILESKTDSNGLAEIFEKSYRRPRNHAQMMYPYEDSQKTNTSSPLSEFK